MAEKNKHWVEQIFDECGAILDGHFELASGRHSGRYLEKALVYPHTEKLKDICFEMACDVRVAKINIDVVVGPTVGGVILSHLLASYLGPFYGKEIVALFTDKDKTGKQVLKRGYSKLVAGRNVLVVDDVLTTGGSVQEVIEEVERAGGRVMAAVVICKGGQAELDYPLYYLYETAIESWTPEECPLCKKGIQITNTK